MPVRKYKPQLHALVAIPVALILLAAFGMSSAAVVENLRFINATNQVLDLVSQVRALAGAQKTFAANPGEDVWADLVGAGQITQETSHPNPWQGQIRMVTVPGNGMRVESDLPTHDCRRMALYFLGKQPLGLGLLSIEAQSYTDSTWKVIYASPDMPRRGPELACGDAPLAHLALVFKVR